MAIKFTEKAVSELKAQKAKQIETSNIGERAVLRVAVEGGGCSGFSYKMGFDENVTETDRLHEIEGIRVVCDHKSFLYLDGTEIDFQDSLMGRGFVFNNPNASGTCGCGHSFQV